MLVLLGTRDIEENFFIDPLSGNRYSTNDRQFLGIESMWDNYNYYVNMQDCCNDCSVSSQRGDLSTRESLGLPWRLSVCMCRA